ncbi:MAG: PHP domain-containing protein [Treponema sp.]|jgi:hypothetical protein|nr:PHP domain-containing protein [Treponema sp.]
MTCPAEINDRSLPPEERLAALEAFIKSGGPAEMPPFNGEVNNHIHTVYSFSPYTPAMAALKARQAGLEAAGSVDHDSCAAAPEMRRACALLGMGCVTGFELRVDLRHTEFASRKINSPDSEGIVYMTVQGIPEGSSGAVRAFLAPLNEARGRRNRLMTETLNKITAADLAPLSYEEDILPLSMAAAGGSVTERHILYALSRALIKRTGPGGALLDFLASRFDLSPGGKLADLLADRNNPYYDYDLLGFLKSAFGDRIFIQPGGDECPRVEEVCAFAKSINAVPSYAYLGDVGDSPTGDKRAEHFEDAYLDELMPRLKEWGFQGITYMPPRNTKAQLERIHKLCQTHGFIEISGVDINSPRQSFNCPEIRRSEFAMLIDSTWALAAHELRCAESGGEGLFNPASPLASKPLNERIGIYAEAGRRAVKERGAGN